MVEHTVSIIAGIYLVCAFCQWLAWRVKLPPILFLLLTGILVGPVIGIVDVDTLLGELLYPFVSLSVAIILFEGSLTLRFKEIAGLEKVVRNLLSVGMLITWFITATATRFTLSVSWEIALMFGAIVVVTGPTVVAPIIKTIRPTYNLANILRWESIVIDPIGASLAVLVYEFIVSGGGRLGVGLTMLTFGKIILVGSLIGIVVAHFFGICLRRHWVPEFLHNIVTLGLVFSAFSLANILQAESGLVTVTCMGVWLANMRGVDIDEILNFKETLSTILISLLFVILAARLDFKGFMEIGWPALFIFLAIQFLARPLSVMICTSRSSLKMQERHMLAWIAPRGIVAAAISALFAYKLEESGVAGASMLLPLTFMVIIGTVVLQSFTAPLIARRLGVMQPEPDGFLIVGANRVARAIAKALQKENVRVLVADSSEDNIILAKEMGLETFWGNPVSGQAERQINLTGIGRMLALSADQSENIAAVFHYLVEFGKKNVFMIRTAEPGKNQVMSEDVSSLQRHFLFSAETDFGTLEEMLNKGGQVLAMENGMARQGVEEDIERSDGFPLFAVSPSGEIYLDEVEKLVVNEKGWKTIQAVTASHDFNI